MHLAPRLSFYHMISFVPHITFASMLGGEGHESPAAQLAAAALPRGGEAVHDGYDGQQGHGPASHTRTLVLRPTMIARGRSPSATPSPRRCFRTLYFRGTCKINFIKLYNYNSRLINIYKVVTIIRQ